MSDQEHERDSEENSEEGEETKDVTEEERPDVLSDYRTEGGGSA